MSVKCADCVHFSAHDVFRGYCKMAKEKVMYDDVKEDCKFFRAAAKCKNCAKYKATGELEGVCTVGDVFAFPDLPGCEDYVSA